MIKEVRTFSEYLSDVLDRKINEYIREISHSNLNLEVKEIILKVTENKGSTHYIAMLIVGFQKIIV